MKQLSTDKYNVAWFKLAELVSRGEKERALAMYRLLAHSIEDQSFIRQLEGDLLLAFGDDCAFDKYADAAILYAKEHRYMEACAIFEHIITLEPEHNTHDRLIELYVLLQKEQRAIDVFAHYLRWMMNKKQFQLVSTLLQKIDQQAPHQTFTLLHQDLVQCWLKTENPPTDPVMVHIKKTIDFYFSIKEQKALQTFLMTLKMMHNFAYQQACGYMQEGNFKF